MSKRLSSFVGPWFLGFWCLWGRSLWTLVTIKIARWCLQASLFHALQAPFCVSEKYRFHRFWCEQSKGTLETTDGFVCFVSLKQLLSRGAKFLRSFLSKSAKTRLACSSGSGWKGLCECQKSRWSFQPVCIHIELCFHWFKHPVTHNASAFISQRPCHIIPSCWCCCIVHSSAKAS